MAIRRAILSLFLLFVCWSFQDENFTSIEDVASSTSLTVNEAIAVTVTILQSKALLSDPVPHQTTVPSCSTNWPARPTTEAHDLPALLSAGSSGSHTPQIEPSPNGFLSLNDIDLEDTLWNTEASNLSFHDQELQSSNDPPPRKRFLNQTEISDDSPGNNTRSPFDWHFRDPAESGRPLPPIEYEPPLDPPKFLPLVNPWLAALAAGAVYLATPDSDDRRKRRRTEEQGRTSDTDLDEAYDIVLQPETRPISQEQLVAEVKGIYARLVVVEAKCIEVDDQQAYLAASGNPSSLSNHQWQALIALHRTLLHEHHDFLLASQHPSASPALRRLASKYAMPARMWRHGIRAFLELMRHRLPESLDHMLAFIYLAYSMMALLYETVPAFEDTWIECLGDLGRYRMAIEDDDLRNREVWTGVATHWYSAASHGAPTAARLYCHLGILARPNALAQHSYLSTLLSASSPLYPARESISKLFDRIQSTAESSQPGQRDLDCAFVKVHGTLFKDSTLKDFRMQSRNFIALLDIHIRLVGGDFREQGYHIAVANSMAMLGFGSKDNLLMRARDFLPEQLNISEELPRNNEFFYSARTFAHETLNTAVRRLGDPNVLPLVHVSLAFMHVICRYPRAKRLLSIDFPWESVVIFLNHLLDSHVAISKDIADDSFPIPAETDARPLPEDFAMRGLIWAEEYFPSRWFSKSFDHQSEEATEAFQTTLGKTERILWLAVRIAKGYPDELRYHPASYDPRFDEFIKPRFSVHTATPFEHSDDNDKVAEYISVTSERRETIRWLACHIAERDQQLADRFASCSPNLDELVETYLSVKAATPFDSSSDTCEIVASVRRFEGSSVSSSFLGSDQLSSSLSTENNLCGGGIHATLASPLDPSEESSPKSLSIAQASSEDESCSMEMIPETLESWLSDMINLDIATAEHDHIDNSHSEGDRQKSAGFSIETFPFVNDPISTTIVVLCQHSRSDNPDEDPAKPPVSEEEHGKDDQNQQGFERAANSWLFSPSKEQESGKQCPAPTAFDTYSKHFELSPIKVLPQPSPWTALSALPSPKPSKCSMSSTPVDSTKSFVCTHTNCQKAFARVSDLNKHIKYHTKPFSCQVASCNYTCGRQQDLDRHQHGVHKDIFGEEEFPCKNCDKKYSRKDNLKRHSEKWHGGDHVEQPGQEGASPS